MYKINFDKIIGTGQNGNIYETNIDLVTKYPVTEQEIKVSMEMSKIIGPNIIKIIKTKTFDETMKISLNGKMKKIKGNFMIMEKLNGLDLNDYIQEEGVFIEDDDFWIQELIMKIKKMHKMGYNHNDLSASNIFIIFNEINKVISVKIIDFGRTTKNKQIDDFKTLLESLYTFGIHISDKIQPLIYLLEEEV